MATLSGRIGLQSTQSSYLALYRAAMELFLARLACMSGGLYILSMFCVYFLLVDPGATISHELLDGSLPNS